MPKGWSWDAADFINKLIQRKCIKRLGYYGIAEVKKQPWLCRFDWGSIDRRETAPFFVPPRQDNFSEKVVSEPFRDENDDRFRESLELIDKPRI